MGQFHCINTAEEKLEGGKQHSRLSCGKPKSSWSSTQLTQAQGAGSPIILQSGKSLEEGKFPFHSAFRDSGILSLYNSCILSAHCPSHQQEVKLLGRDAPLVTGLTAAIALGGLHILSTRQL